MTALPEVLLAAVALFRILLYRRQRRSLLQQAGVFPVGVTDALQRARRLLRAELTRVLIATLLLLLIDVCACLGLSGLSVPLIVAVCAYLANSIIDARMTAAGWRGRGAAIILGMLMAALAAVCAGMTIGRTPWMLWLLAGSAVGAVAMGAYQLIEWQWLRLRREARVRVADIALNRRLTELAQHCGIAGVSFQLVDNDGHTANARAESDLRGRRVVLWPALLQRLGVEELEAVVAHELGHLVHRHLLARFLNASALLFVAVTLSSLLAATLWAPAGPTADLHLATVAALLPLILASARFRLLALYRRQELEADQFVCKQGSGPALAAALLKLSPSIAGTPASDRWHQRAYDSHPSNELRLQWLRAPT